MTHFELTDETRTLADGTVLNRIRATQDLPHHGVTAGDLGGWVEHAHNLSGQAWVSGHALVTGQALVTDRARVTGHALVTGQARVTGHAQVSGQALVTDRARVTDQAQVTDKAHVVTVGPIGSEGCTATLHRTTDGHALHIGCWTGTIDTLPAEIARRRRTTWDAPQAVQEAWVSQYAALILLGRSTITTWTPDRDEDS